MELLPTVVTAGKELDRSRKRRGWPVAEVARRTPSLVKTGTNMKWVTTQNVLDGTNDSIAHLNAVAETLGLEMTISFTEKGTA